MSVKVAIHFGEINIWYHQTSVLS